LYKIAGRKVQNLDKATLVRSDVDSLGRVMLALSRSRIPVTLCDLNYVPQLDEWQLVIATPWYDTRGPLEAFSKVVSALQNDGIYSAIPIRRVFVKSPEDPLVKALQETKTEGAIHIADYGRRGNGSLYSLVFSPFSGPGGAVPSVRISGPEQLRKFLEDRLHVGRSQVDEALRELKLKGNTFIPHVQLTKRQAKTLGLA
jgi:hypothetical protein